jgi:hypothetical protein
LGCGDWQAASRRQGSSQLFEDMAVRVFFNGWQA